MHWVILFASALLEAVWATALGLSEGFTQAVPTAVFLVATTASMVGLAYAIRSIPLGTAYSVWTGLGAALTASYAMLTGAESVSPLKIVFLLVIVASSIGLKVIAGKEEDNHPAG